MQQVKSKTPQQLTQVIDHTLLKANSTPDQILKLCQEAIKYKFKSVCVNSSYIKLAHEKIHGKQQNENKDIIVGAAIGFPLGMMSTQSKGFEAKIACQQGAGEIDMVMNIGRFLAGDYEYVTKDIEHVRNQIDSVRESIILKVIIQICYLDDDGDENKTDGLIEKACRLAIEAGANYVKTSTGFGSGGATQSAVRRMKKVCNEKGGNFKVKASGGIGSYQDICDMLASGADRIGASKGVQIIEEANKIFKI